MKIILAVILSLFVVGCDQKSQPTPGPAPTNVPDRTGGSGR